MAKNVKRRTYDANARRAASDLRRRRILHTAKDKFIEDGYAGATMADIAARADVAVDTVYELVGRKPALFRLLIESAISGQDEAVPAEERDYVRAIHDQSTARGKLAVYAAAIPQIHARLAPLVTVLQAAAPTDPALDALCHEISERRAVNMRRLADELLATGELRSTAAETADVLWATNSPEFYLLLVGRRGWTAAHYEQWLLDAWVRLLLAQSS